MTMLNQLIKNLNIVKQYAEGLQVETGSVAEPMGMKNLTLKEQVYHIERGTAIVIGYAALSEIITHLQMLQKGY
jgi:hypothetical protein